MAKAKAKNTESWVPFQQIFKAELDRFGARGPALHAARQHLQQHPYRYLDQNGRQHEGDLTSDFIRHASFQPDQGSAICPLVVVVGGPRVPHYEAYRIEIKTAVAMVTASGKRKRPPIKFNRVLDILKNLGPRVRPGMQPHEIEELVRPEYRARHGGTVSRRIIAAAYEAHMAATSK